MNSDVVILAVIDPDLLLWAAVIGGLLAGVLQGVGLTAIAAGAGLTTAGFILGRNVPSLTTEDQGGFWPTLFLFLIAGGCFLAGGAVGTWLKDHAA